MERFSTILIVTNFVGRVVCDGHVTPAGVIDCTVGFGPLIALGSKESHSCVPEALHVELNIMCTVRLVLTRTLSLLLSLSLLSSHPSPYLIQEKEKDYTRCLHPQALLRMFTCK